MAFLWLSAVGKLTVVFTTYGPFSTALDSAANGDPDCINHAQIQCSPPSLLCRAMFLLTDSGQHFFFILSSVERACCPKHTAVYTSCFPKFVGGMGARDKGRVPDLLKVLCQSCCVTVTLKSELK